MTAHQQSNDGCGCGCGCGTDSVDGLEKENREHWELAPDDEIVCHCAHLDKKHIVRAIRNGAYTLPLVKILTGLGQNNACPRDNQCIEALKHLLSLYGNTTASELTAVSKDE